MASGWSSWKAFTLGFGAAIASPGLSEAHSATDPTLEPRAGHVIIKVEGDRMLFSELGSEFQELVIDDGATSTRLRNLLNALRPEGGAVVVPVGPTIVADGGATGHWSARKPRQGSQSGD